MTSAPAVMFNGTRHTNPASLLTHICLELKAKDAKLDTNSLMRLIRSSLPIILSVAANTENDIELIMSKNGSMSLNVKNKLEYRPLKKIDYMI